MQSNKSALSFSVLGLLTLFSSERGFAGGTHVYEIATDNAGLANAGAGARAQGPSTIASNPAGMSYLRGTQITADAQILFGNLSFERDGATDTPGTGSGHVLDPIPGASFFISHQLDEQWSVGFGSYGDFGLAETTTTTGLDVTSCRTRVSQGCRWYRVWLIASTSNGQWVSV